MPLPKSTALYVPRACQISTSLIRGGSLLSLLTETALLRLFSAQYNESCSLPGYSAGMGLSMDSFSRNHLARPKLPSFWALQRLGACGPARCTPAGCWGELSREMLGLQLSIQSSRPPRLVQELFVGAL